MQRPLAFLDCDPLLFNLTENLLSASDPFIGEISLVAFSYAPDGWALCDGRLLSVSQYGALLFSAAAIGALVLVIINT